MKAKPNLLEPKVILFSLIWFVLPGVIYLTVCSGWQFLDIDSVPHYTDTTPITAPATWKYRAMYIVADELVGQ